MIKYCFREDEPIRLKAAAHANPQVIGEALEKITEANGGVLKPIFVVDAARKKTHPLHPHFEWNDGLAAEAYRLDQARNVIRIVRVEDEDVEEGTSRAFVSVHADDNTAYHPVATVKRSADLQFALFRQAKRELEAFERRYKSLTDICALVTKAREALERKLVKDETRVAA